MKLAEIINSNSVWYGPLYLAVCIEWNGWVSEVIISSVMVRVVEGKMSIVIDLHIAFLQYMTRVLVLYNQQWLLESHYVYPASIRCII